MEVAMTRTAIRHTLSVLAALALVSAFAANSASSQFDSQINDMMNNNIQMPAQSKTKATHNWGEIESLQINTPKGRASPKTPHLTPHQILLDPLLY
jgi:hypothetical protein